MSEQLTITRQFHVRQGTKGRLELRQGQTRGAEAADRIPRVSRLMALAIRFEHLIREGAVTDQAELARLGHVSRARLTQVMNMLNLAPDIQEEILFLPRLECGRDPVTETQLRSIAAVSDWRKQRRMRVATASLTEEANLDEPRS